MVTYKLFLIIPATSNILGYISAGNPDVKLLSTRQSSQPAFVVVIFFKQYTAFVCNLKKIGKR